MVLPVSVSTIDTLVITASDRKFDNKEDNFDPYLVDNRIHDAVTKKYEKIKN